MKVNELIKRLQELESDADVVISDNWEFIDLSHVSTLSWHYGPQYEGKVALYYD
jgi:hypothetical protein